MPAAFTNTVGLSGNLSLKPSLNLEHIMHNKFNRFLTYSIIIISSILFFTDQSKADDHLRKSYAIDGPETTIFGNVVILRYGGNETLAQLGRRFGVGYLSIADANPEITPTSNVNGLEVIIPTAWIVPELMYQGILINLAELRLYFFESNVDATTVTAFPIGIGRSGYNTPTGEYEITRKIKNPSWFPSKSSRKLNPELPEVIPPGPRNPLGRHWIQLSIKGYGIHGTKKPSSIGKKVSLGCIRLFNKDVEWLYERAYEGMPVRIIDQSVKLGLYKENAYIEIHRNGHSLDELIEMTEKMISGAGLSNIPPSLIEKIAIQSLGVPVRLTGQNQSN